MTYSKRLAVVAVVSAIFISATAPGLTVQEVGVGSGQSASISVTGFYTGPVAVGIIKLLVDGVAADGFCIDPFHFSVPSSDQYEFRSLAEAPKPFPGMGLTKADDISKLWAMAYSPDMSAELAAGLQIAIWETVGGDNFSVSGNDYGAGILLQGLADYSGPGARLIALSGPGQDYVTPTVPEGGSTLTFLTLAAAGLAAVHFVARSFRFPASERRS